MSQQKPIAEHKVLMARDAIAAGAHPAPAAVKVNPTPLVGTWLNADKSTPSLVKIILSQSGGDLFIEAFGACVPSPCPWGKVKATAFSSGVSSNGATSFLAHYDQGFADRTVTGSLFEGALVVDIFTVFKDNSGRDNYHFQDTLYRP